MIQKITKRMLLMAKHLLKLWFEHADVEMTGEQWDHQVQRLYPFDRMFGAVSLNGRMGVQARVEEVAGVAAKVAGSEHIRSTRCLHRARVGTATSPDARDRG